MTFPADMPPWMQWDETQRLIAAFGAQGAPMRFVGGCVRDWLVSRAVTDIDIATPLVPQAVMAMLEKHGIRAIETGIAHGTVTAVIGGRAFEITTLRKDTACDGRHAVVEYTDDWREDAKRRDFTINALYLSPQGDVFDYFQGVDDARAGRVRFIGDARQRIREDYLRILRFFRFYVWYGRGMPDPEALQACAELADGMEGLSGERIQQEMLKLLAAPQSRRVVALMRETGILAQALGATIHDTDLLARLEELFPDADPVEKLAALAGVPEESAAQRKAMAAHLKLSNAMASVLLQVRTLTPDMNQAELYRFYLQHRQAFLVSAKISAASSATPEACRALIGFQPPEFPLTGDDLLKRGWKQGRQLGETLQRLQDQWANSGYAMTREALLASLPDSM